MRCQPGKCAGLEAWTEDRDFAAVHAWARGLPWWVFVLVHRWLPDYSPGGPGR